MSKHFYLILFIMASYANRLVMAKKVAHGKAQAAPGWNPLSSEEDEPPILTRRFLTPATLPPLPLPPIDPDIDLDDRSVLIAANEQAEDNEPSSTTETTNLKVVPFHGHRHQTILPIPPSINEQVEEENSSGEEDVRDRILIPASIEPPDSRPTELLVPANSDEIPPQTILVPTESDSRNIEFIPIGESDRSAKESDSGGMPPSIRPPSSHRPPTTQQPSHHRHKVKIKRPKPFEIVPPPPTVRRPSRIIEPSTEFVQEELESDELVPVVEPIAEPTIILPSHHRYATVPKLVEKPQTIEKPRIVERPKSLERAEYFQTKRPSIVLPPKKTRKIYKVYRPDVVEVDQGPFPSSHRPIYVAKRPPILVEQIEIPAELIESLQQYSTPAPKVFERTTLRKGSGQFVPRRSSSYRRAYRPPQTTEPPVEETTSTQPVTTLPPSTVKRRYNTSYRRLLFTYKPRFITTTTEQSDTTQIPPVEYVYKKPASSYRELVVRQKQKSVVYRKQAKNYPKHRKYSRAYKTKRYPQGYQRQLTRHSFYGYA